MKVIRIKEQKDGSALVTIDLNRNEEEKLIEYAVNDILKKQVKKLRKEKNKK